jgi:hypothetical protein
MTMNQRKGTRKGTYGFADVFIFLLRGVVLLLDAAPALFFPVDAIVPLMDSQRPF